MERLDIGLGEVKLLADATAGEMTFAGYGAVFGNIDAYGDVIAKGAFKATLADAKKSKIWPAMLSQHGGGFWSDDPTPIGIWTEMNEDEKGLYVEGKLADTTKGREAYALLKMEPRPALNGLSIGYMTKEATLGTKPGEPRRTLKRVDLMEVSLVTFPANPKARVESVKAAERVRTIRDFEGFLRDAGGYSHAAAKAIAAGGYKACPDPRDEDGAAELRSYRERFRALRPST